MAHVIFLRFKFVRNSVYGQAVFQLFGFVLGNRKVYHIRNALCVRNQFGMIGKKAAHLLFAFHIELVAFVAHTVCVAAQLFSADAQKHVLCNPVFGVHIVNVVRYDHWNVHALGNGYEQRRDAFLIFQAVVLQFDKKVFFAEYALIQHNHFFGFFVLPRKQKARKLPGQTCRRTYQTF